MIFHHELLIFFVCLNIIHVKSAENIDEVILIDNFTSSLFKTYDPRRKPSYQLQMYLNIQFNQLISIDEKNQIMTSSFYLGVDWVDDRLTWNLTEYNQSGILVPVNKLWLPDLYIINTADINGFINYSNQYALIGNDGNVTLLINLCLLKTRCQINIARFPFDNQTCNIQIGSWSFDDDQIEFVGKESLLDTIDYIENAVWFLQSVSSEEKETRTRLGVMTDINFKIQIKRRPTNYMLNNLYPCFVLNVVTLLTFWIPFAPAFAAGKLNDIFLQIFRDNKLKLKSLGFGLRVIFKDFRLSKELIGKIIID